MKELINVDWRVIFHSKSYHSIFINNGENKESIKVVYNNWDSIQSTKGFFLMLPTFTDYYNDDKSQYLKKFAPLLKQFFDSKETKTLITEQDVFEHLIKEDSRVKMLQVLKKLGKNIVVFGNGSLIKYIPEGEDYLIKEIDEKEWNKSIYIFNRFQSIKEAIKNTHNPFKNPLYSGELLLEQYNEHV